GRLTDVQVAADANATSWRPFKRFEFGTAGVANGKLLTATRHNYLWQTTTTPRDMIVTDNYTYQAATGAVAERKTCAATITDSTLTNCDQAPASAKHAFTAKYSYNEIGALAETQYPSCDVCPAGNVPSRFAVNMFYNGFPTAFGTKTNQLDAPTTIATAQYAPNGMVKNITRQISANVTLADDI